jgi:hypothetical protein
MHILGWSLHSIDSALRDFQIINASTFNHGLEWVSEAAFVNGF